MTDREEDNPLTSFITLENYARVESQSEFIRYIIPVLLTCGNV